MEALPDDNYRIEVFGFDDPARGIVGLRNTDGDLFVPSDPSLPSEVVNFELRLGAFVESIVPQPVVRQEDGSLAQNRDEIVVFFSEDELFIENDEAGNPTERSAENPRFYQLLLTQETVRTTDDVFFNPDSVVYDAATHTARLFFSDDINELTGRDGGGTWRLRIGTAVEADPGSTSVPPELGGVPEQLLVQPSAVTDFQHPGLRVEFQSLSAGESSIGQQLSLIHI